MKTTLLKIVSLALSVAALGLGALVADTASHAAALQHEAQVQGYYRTKVGAFEITALLDGTSTFDAHWLKAETAALQPLATKHFQQADKLVGTVSACLVNTGKELILVDTGAGGFWGGPAFGHLAESLRASGYRPEQVDRVLLTHLHADHVAGLRNPDGKRRFPNATVSMLRQDSDFWLSKEIASKAPPEAKEFFDLAQASAKPYQAAGKWKPIAPGDEVAPGVRSRPIAGHTPGHTGPAPAVPVTWALAQGRERVRLGSSAVLTFALSRHLDDGVTARPDAEMGPSIVTASTSRLPRHHSAKTNRRLLAAVRDHGSVSPSGGQ